jgi:murein DD-endopeptidase MepM/ murein hydrolase activator NlpD
VYLDRAGGIKYQYTSGTSWSDVETIGTGSSFDIATNREGNAHIVWSAGNDVFYRSFEGDDLSDPINLSNTNTDADKPSIAIDVHDRLHVTWEETVSGKKNVYYKSRERMKWDTTQENVSNTDYASIGPNIAVGDNPHVVWRQSIPSLYNQIYYSTKTLEPKYIISGRITNESNDPIPDVTVSASETYSATTDTEGNYWITSVVSGTYTIKPTMNGNTFYPAIRNVAAPPSIEDQNFIIPDPFLEFPVDYDDFYLAIQGNTSDVSPGEPGKIRSWFDHQYPDYKVNNIVRTWLNNKHEVGDLSVEGCTTGLNCYDDHNGLDIQHDDSKQNESVFAAYSGIVLNKTANPLVKNCRDGDRTCSYIYGNQVWIDHQNGYATLYGHLRSVEVNDGQEINNHHKIGVLGNTGSLSTGKHLHFGLYYDKDNNGIWAQNEVVDPYGWDKEWDTDPWYKKQGNISRWMWKYPRADLQIGDSTGKTVTSLSGIKTVIIPENALDTQVTIELIDTPPYALPAPGYWTTGQGLIFRIKEWDSSGTDLSKSPILTTTNDSGFLLPVTVEINYASSTISHLDETGLSIVQYDPNSESWTELATILDTENKKASAQTLKTGYFDLLAPRICPSDNIEPNDNYFSASVLPLQEDKYTSLFDNDNDEDWYIFEAESGMLYTIRTTNLDPGMEASTELYDIDGVTLLGIADYAGNGSHSILEWRAPKSGDYYLRVAQKAESVSGCKARYEILVDEGAETYIPFVEK